VRQARDERRCAIAWKLDSLRRVGNEIPEWPIIARSVREPAVLASPATSVPGISGDVVVCRLRVEERAEEVEKDSVVVQWSHLVLD